MATVKKVLCSVVLLCCISMGYAKSSIKRQYGLPGYGTGGYGTDYSGSTCHHDTCTSFIHGTCYNGHCVCHLGYTGKHCEITVSHGTHAPLTHAPTTFAPSPTLAPATTYTDWISRCITCHCTNQCDPTEEQKCSHYFPMIECSNEYSGYTCYVDTCSGRGSCYHVEGVGRHCVCDQGHYGIKCELDHPVTFAPPTTHAPPTSTIAISTPTTSQVVTSSTTSPTTMTSSTVPDYCSTFPCGIHGKCTNTGSGYQCTCSPGYTGLNCEVDIDQCVSSPCQNGGSCLTMGSSYICMCEDGWSGTTCGIDATPACNHRCVLEPVANVHSVPSNGSSNCIDRSKSANEALPMECCGLAKEDTWLKGIQVMPHCSDDTVLPLYTPVASFHEGRPVNDTAGVFLGCDTNGFKYIKQMCNTTAHIITIPDGTGVDPQSFYVIY